MYIPKRGINGSNDMYTLNFNRFCQRSDEFIKSHTTQFLKVRLGDLMSAAGFDLSELLHILSSQKISVENTNKFLEVTAETQFVPSLYWIDHYSCR